jgi:carboxymethylenebutenolidase
MCEDGLGSNKQEQKSMDGRDDRLGGGLSRRAVVMGSIGVGFAMAVQPVVAQNLIVTSSEGLKTGEVKVKTSTGEILGYRAMPATGAGFPVVLVVPEIFGLHEHIRDVVRRFAKLGYYAIAVDQFWRLGDASKMADVPTIVRDLVSKTPDAQVMSDFDAAVAFAKGEGADTAKLGITGFCLGGRYVWLYAEYNPNLKAAVAWYGSLKGGTSDIKPKSPLDLAAQLKAPVLGLYAGKDTGITADHIEEMKKALAAANKKAEFVVYPDAQHGFNADYRSTYNKEAAEDGWKRMLAFFKANGVGRS